jgi:taurine dioxygenase
MKSNHLHVNPLSPHIGATIRGVDLRQTLDEETVAEIRTALLDHLVLFFEDQDISAEQHLAFARQFGDIEEPHPVFGMHTHDPRLTIIESRGREGDDDHEWHSDVTYQNAPTMGSILHSRIIPPRGGDTLFASAYAAFDALSGPMQRFLSTLTASHSFELGWGKSVRRQPGGDDRMRELNAVFPPMSHPVVRTHPETGRKSLFINQYYTTHINELSEKESAGLLRILFNHFTTPEFQIRHRWKRNEIAFWDNRSTLHYATHDYGKHHRLMHRVTLVGDVPQ